MEDIKSIKLINLNLTNINIEEQFLKMQEEENELHRALEELDEDHIVEEFWDTVQAKLGLLDKYGIGAELVASGYEKHLEKMKNRPR